jgi:cytochrome c556
MCKTHKRVLTSLCIVSLVVAAVAARCATAGSEPEPQSQTLKKEMARKLKLAQSLLTGLTFEDFGVLAGNAEALKRVGEETLTKVSPDLTYVKYSTEFVTLTEELARRAKARDLNGATLSYIRLTINCVECHKHVRDFPLPELKR